MQVSQKRLALSVLGVVGLLLMLGFGSNYMRSKEPQPEYVFYYAENQTPDYPTTLGALEFARLVEEQTKGRIRILVRAEAELGTEKEVIKQMEYGGIDFARVSISQLAEHVPKLNVLQMPYLYEDSSHMWRVLDGAIGAEFLQISKECDLVGLSWYDAGARNFYTTGQPITCLEDMQGMYIRVQESEMMASMVEALGATAVQIGYGDVYSCLQTGVVDGAENNWPSYEAMQHYEVAEFYTVDEHTRVPEMQICSKHTWEKLSTKDQEIIRNCAQQSALYERELWAEREAQAKQKALVAGIKVTELSASEKKRFREAMTQLYQTYGGEYLDIIEQIVEE